jgi:hypothetical protein
VPVLEAQPRSRLYWGYIWDAAAGRCTRPIRDPIHKSYMSLEQHPGDSYPPFASGCGFVLSADLGAYLVQLDEADRSAGVGGVGARYRLIDAGLGLLLAPLQLTPVHEPRVRPYRCCPPPPSPSAPSPSPSPRRFPPAFCSDMRLQAAAALSG